MTLNIPLYAQGILQTHNIITDNAGVHFYTHEGGYYDLKNSEKRLTQLIYRRIIDSGSDSPITNNVKEILNYIKAITYQETLLQDVNKEYICLKNGSFNVHKMEMSKHNSDIIVTYRIPITMRWGAKENTMTKIRWREYISNLVGEKDVTRLQEAMGNILADHYETKKVVYIYGGRDSGKSTFFRIIQETLGLENYSNVSLTQLKDLFFASQLYGKRANFCSEIPYKLKTYNLDLIKTYTGNDMIAMRKIYKDVFQAKNIAKLFFAGNGIPNVNEDEMDDAFLRRWEFIKFPNHFEPDESLFRIMTTDEMKSSIFNWMIKGYVRLKKQKWKFTNGTSVQEAAEIFLTKSDTSTLIDPFEQWIGNNCMSDDECWELKEDLFRHWHLWFTRSGFRPVEGVTPLNIMSFGRRMKEQRLIPVTDYYPRIKNKQKTAYKGIRIGKGGDTFIEG